MTSNCGLNSLFALFDREQGNCTDSILPYQVFHPIVITIHSNLTRQLNCQTTKRRIPSKDALLVLLPARRMRTVVDFNQANREKKLLWNGFCRKIQWAFLFPFSLDLARSMRPHFQFLDENLPFVDGLMARKKNRTAKSINCNFTCLASSSVFESKAERKAASREFYSILVWLFA